VTFVYDADTASRDITIYGATTGSSWLFDMDANELILNGVDLWLMDEDTLEFGDASDFVIDWSTADGLQFLPQAAGNDITFGTSSLYVDADWDMGNMDIDLYATTGIGVDIQRNLTSGSTNNVVVYMENANASDDQAVLQVVQDAADTVGCDLDCALDIDIPSGYTSGVGMTVSRNLTSGNTDNVVALFENLTSADDQATVKITQAATGYLALDVGGFTDLGYTTSEPSESTVDLGAVRVFKDATNWYLAIHTTSDAGTYKFACFDLTTGGIS
jgi:hypothetical protein